MNDYVGKKYGKLTVISDSNIRIGNRPTLNCTCDCGKKNVLVQRKKLLSGHTKSCGCLHREHIYSHSNLVGKTFGRLTVINTTDERDKKGRIIWECRCNCGNVVKLNTSSLKSGNTKSCGCLHLDNGYLSAVKKNVFEHYDKTCVSIIKRKKPNQNNKLGKKGVYFDKSRKKYMTQIMFKRKRYQLGRYDTLEEAVRVRQDAESKLHDNFIEWYEKNVKGDKLNE